MKEFNLETQRMLDSIRVFCVDCCARAFAVRQLAGMPSAA